MAPHPSPYLLNNLTNISKQQPLYTLDNGLKICLITRKNINSISIHAFINVGSVYETEDNSGISHFLEHMIFRGNQKLGNTLTTYRKIEAIGGNINATTSCDQTEIYLDYHKRFFEKGIQYFCNFIKYPGFEDIETERKIILEESLSDYNTKQELIDTDTLTAQCIWPSSSLNLPIIGSQKSINKINLNDVKSWFHKFFVPNNMIVSLTGDFDKADTIALIEKEMSDLKPAEFPTPEISPVVINPEKQAQFVFDDDNQYAVQWSFPIETDDMDDYIKAHLINRILDDGSSSQLQKLVREEKGLVYDISSDITYFRQGILFSIQSTVSKNKALELMEVLTQLIRDIIKNGFNSDEIALAKLRYQLSLDCYKDSLGGLLSDKLNPHIYPFLPSFKTISNMINEVDSKDLNILAERFFNQKNSAFVMVGPVDKKIKKEILPLIKNWIQ